MESLPIENSFLGTDTMTMNKNIRIDSLKEPNF